MPTVCASLPQMLVIGIDENGLGPVLGPLLVTAAAFETEQYDAEQFWKAAGAELLTDDSKKIFSSTKLGSAEVAVWAWLRKFGIKPTTYADLFSRIVQPMPVERPCTLEPAYCGPSATPLPCFAAGKDMAWLSEESKSLAVRGIRPAAVRAFSICPGAFNRACAVEGMNKFALDFMLMLRLVMSLSEGYEGDVLALCGKVGSTRKYGPWFGRFHGGLWMPEEETPEISTYRIVPFGRISFIRDGDGSHLPIAAASMVGKYLRELAMRDINTLLLSPGIRTASGYRDKITQQFIEKTEALRHEVGLKDACFLRDS